jgi:hypothetical protein
MKSPPKKKQKKEELSCTDKATIVRTLIALRENKTMTRLYRDTLQEISNLCGKSEITILNWMKPSVREQIYKKAQSMLADAQSMLADGAKLNIDTSQILDDNVRSLLCSPSHISSLGSDAVVKNSNNSNTR